MKIAYFAPISFSYLKQRPQHIAELLSIHHEIVYIEPTISFMKYLLKGGEKFTAIKYKVNDNLSVIRANGKYTLHKSLEFFDVFNINTLSEYKQLYEVIDDCDIIWAGYPVWQQLIKRFPTKPIVYDKMDENSQLTSNLLLKKVVENSEIGLLKSADVVLATCEQLYTALQQKHSQVYLIRNGVSLDWLKTAQDESVAMPKEKRVFGYVGAISHWFDFDVLDTILEQDSNNEILLVGDNMMPVVKHPRVHYMGVIKKEKLASIMKHFDICLYNFKRTDLLDTIDPVKIYEYLAFNKPVLAVQSKETMRFANKLMLYKSKEDIISHLKSNIVLPFKSLEEQQLFLQENSWETRVSEIEVILETLYDKHRLE